MLQGSQERVRSLCPRGKRRISGAHEGEGLNTNPRQPRSNLRLCFLGSQGPRRGSQHLGCSLWSCLVFNCKSLKIKLMSFPAADGWGPMPPPWHPALVIFLLNKETGCLTSGGDLGALHSRRLKNNVASSDRWPHHTPSPGPLAPAVQHM